MEKTTKDVKEEVKNVHHLEDFFADFDFAGLELSLEDLFKQGVHFGHKKSRRNPRMDEYVYIVKNDISIIDLTQTLEKFQEALHFIEALKKEDRQVLFVGTKKHAQRLVKSAAKKCKLPYVTERWLGGTFTNFEMIKKRIKHLKDLEQKIASGELAQKYTKFEQLKKSEEVEKLERRMGGLKEMNEIPGAIFIVDIKQDAAAVKEATSMKVPIIAFVDTNDNPDGVDYPIPANNDAVSSLKYLLGNVCKAYTEGKPSQK